MNFKYEFDKTNVKIDKDGKIKYFLGKNSSGEPAFFEFNLGLLYMPYLLFPSTIAGCFEQINKEIRNYFNPSNQPNASVTDKVGIIPVTGNDTFNYVARYGMANFQIQIVLKLNSRLDRHKLLEAIRLSIASEPVFGCRFVEKQPPYWKPLDNIDSVSFCTFEETSDPDRAVKTFLESPLDMDKDPMVKMKLFTCGEQDTLCLKINHTSCDGTGAKEYVKLLSHIYTSIDKDKESFAAVPKMRSRKEQDLLFRTLGINDPQALFKPHADIPSTMWTFPWLHGSPRSTTYSICKLPKGHVDIMSKYGKSKGATINDLILTAVYRAMFEMSQPFYGIPMDISITVDLRRYLPDQKTEAIRNFSGGANTKLARVFNESFEGTLSRVKKLTDRLKNGRPGLQSAIGLERVERDNIHDTLSFYRNVSQFMLQFSRLFCHCSPVLSNLGLIDKSLLKFGDAEVTDAYVVPPALCAPGILLCLGTYNDELTISISYYEGQVRRGSIEKLLYLIKKELVEGCKI